MSHRGGGDEEAGERQRGRLRQGPGCGGQREHDVPVERGEHRADRTRQARGGHVRHALGLGGREGGVERHARDRGVGARGRIGFGAGPIFQIEIARRTAGAHAAKFTRALERMRPENAAVRHCG